MGYYITQGATKFTINKEEIPHANECLLNLFNKPNAKLAWVDAWSVLASCKNGYFEDAMSECGWPVSVDANGNIFNIYFEGDKSGDEEMIFDTIAPAVCDGSYITILGEDGDSWRYFFKHGKVETINGVSVYGDVYTVTEITTGVNGVDKTVSSVYIDMDDAMRAFAEMRKYAIRQAKECSVEPKVDYYETTSLRTVSVATKNIKTIITINEAPIS